MPMLPLPRSLCTAEIVAFTDGALLQCSQTGLSFGGWGILLTFQEHRKEMSGAECNTTIGLMELTAIHKAVIQLTAKDHGHRVRVYSDSLYAVEAINRERDFFIKNGTFAGKSKNPKANQIVADIVARLPASEFFIQWVKGHADLEGNELADKLAVAARTALRSEYLVDNSQGGQERKWKHANPYASSLVTKSSSKAVL